MAKKINTMSPEQEALIPVWREEWRAVGLSTERIVPETSRQAIRDLYTAAGLDEPELILVAQSPMQALLMRGVLMKTDIWGQLRDQLRGQLMDQLGDQLGDQLVDQLGGQLRDQLGGQLRDQLGDQLGGRDLWQSLWMVGGWDSFWLAFYVAGRSVGATFPRALDAHLNAYTQYARSCGVAFCYPKVAFVCDRPTVIEMDDARRLHSETGPALAWSDGYAIHAWHGRRVPGNWIEDTANVDPVEVIRHANVEMRATGAAILGWPRMLKHLKAKVIHDSGNPDIGQLIELTLPGLPDPGRFLKAECPRNGTIVEGVPLTSDIDGLPIDTALAAQAWRIGDPQSEYVHPEVRT